MTFQDRGDSKLSAPEKRSIKSISFQPTYEKTHYSVFMERLIKALSIDPGRLQDIELEISRSDTYDYHEDRFQKSHYLVEYRTKDEKSARKLAATLGNLDVSHENDDYVVLIDGNIIATILVDAFGPLYNKNLIEIIDRCVKGIGGSADPEQVKLLPTQAKKLEGNGIFSTRKNWGIMVTEIFPFDHHIGFGCWMPGLGGIWDREFGLETLSSLFDRSKFPQHERLHCYRIKDLDKFLEKTQIIPEFLKRLEKPIEYVADSDRLLMDTLIREIKIRASQADEKQTWIEYAIKNNIRVLPVVSPNINMMLFDIVKAALKIKSGTLLQFEIWTQKQKWDSPTEENYICCTELTEQEARALFKVFQNAYVAKNGELFELRINSKSIIQVFKNLIRKNLETFLIKSAIDVPEDLKLEFEEGHVKFAMRISAGFDKSHLDEAGITESRSRFRRNPSHPKDFCIANIGKFLKATISMEDLSNHFFQMERTAVFKPSFVYDTSLPTQSNIAKGLTSFGLTSMQQSLDELEDEELQKVMKSKYHQRGKG